MTLLLIFKLAFRNMLGAGLRTWLNTLALSFAFVTIITLQGLYNGMNEQVEQATIAAIYGGGQYWHERYDPLDPLSLADAHGTLPPVLDSLVRVGLATPILVRQATIYPHGRFRTILVKGISPHQSVISLPSSRLADTTLGIPALIGSRMARSAGLQKGDVITVQWRTGSGMFDARDVHIVDVFRTAVQEIDNDQLWIPLAHLQRLSDLPDEATIVVLSNSLAQTRLPSSLSRWQLKDRDFLLKDLHEMVLAKSIGGSIMYTILMLLALLAIFDTQVLSIWRRRKEIGTLMALGMTRARLVGLFTTEGAFHAMLAALVGAVYGIPLLGYLARVGWELPASTDDLGFALGERIFPIYSAGLILGTTLLVFTVTTIVSYIPARKIAQLKPTDALRGKIL